MGIILITQKNVLGHVCFQKTLRKEKKYTGKLFFYIWLFMKNIKENQIN